MIRVVISSYTRRVILTKVAYFFSKIDYHTSTHNPKSTVPSVAPILQVRVSTMLLLTVVGKYVKCDVRVACTVTVLSPSIASIYQLLHKTAQVTW
jgi:hypothetical protein